MIETPDRLSRCFRVVFPELNPAQIEQADMKTVSRWDSVNHIMLLTVIGEEFGIEPNVEDYEELTSYSDILNYIRDRSLGV
jgi:acyl carrier protein